MNKNKKSPLNALLNISSTALRASFVDKKVELSDDQIKILSKYMGSDILNILVLSSRKMYVSVVDSYDFLVSVNKLGKEVMYYPFLVQFTSGLFLVVASKFNIYDHLDREPHRESIGEFRYQSQVAKALGLKNAIAYDLPREQLFNENYIVKNDSELMYCDGDKFSFLIYFL